MGMRALRLALAAVALLSLGLLAWFYRRFLLSGLDIVAESTGSRTTALLTLALGFLAILWVLIWLLFPIFVYLGLRDLRRRTAELDLNARLCAHHLARLAEGRHGSPSLPSPDGQSPGDQSPGAPSE